MAWIDSFALALTCNTFSQYKKDFKKVVEEELKKTDLKPENVFNGLRQGVAITGSFLHQCVFGTNYPGSDIDFIKMGEGKIQSSQIYDVLMTINPKGSGKLQLSHYRGSDQGFGKNKELGYRNILPCETRKVKVLPVDLVPWKELGADKTDYRSARNFRLNFSEYTKEHDKEFKTMIEAVLIEPCDEIKSIHQFINRFTDISFCRMYFDGKLRIQHLDDLFTRTFSMDWNISRYQSSLHPNLTTKDHVFLRSRLNMRCLKYQKRGFTCRNIHEFPETEQ